MKFFKRLKWFRFLFLTRINRRYRDLEMWRGIIFVFDLILFIMVFEEGENVYFFFKMVMGD